MKKISDLAKKVDVIAAFFYWLGIVALVLCLMLVIIVFSLKKDFYEGMEFGVVLGFVDFQWASVCTPDVQTMQMYCVGMCVLAVVIMVFVCVEIAIIRSILKPMKEKRPFDISVSKNIRKLSWVILIGDGICSLMEYFLQIWQYHTFDFSNIFLSDKIIGVSADFELDTTFIVVFFIVYLLSYVFQYGEELQIQSDETL